MASRLGQRIADEITDIGYQVFPDISWVHNKQLHVSGPCTSEDYQSIEEQVLNSPLVTQSIENIYNESGIPLTKLTKEAKSIFDSLNNEISTVSTKAMAYFLRKFWRSAYDGVFVNLDGLKRIKRAQQQGPVILLPTHKSYADFIIISYLFYEHNMAIPRIISGANLNFAGMGNLLKKAGAIWIRRSFTSDKLYQAVFEAYLHCLLSHGTMLEVFIEGGRSRVGKVLSPKIGFLRTIVNILIRDAALWHKDIQCFPISISYDKLMESSSYTSEMLGSEKQTESLQSFISSVNKVKGLRFGSINIEIGKAFSMKQKILDRLQLSDAYQVRRKLSSPAQIKSVCLKMAHEALYEMNLLTAVTATSCVAAVLLTQEKRGISVKTLGEKIAHFIDLVQRRKGKLASILVQSANADIVVDNALKVMHKLVTNRDGIVSICDDNACIELSMYRNHILHTFIHESLVSIAIVSLFKVKGNIRTEECYHETVKKTEVMQCTQFLSKLLKHEFMYKPATSFMVNFDETLDFMIADQAILSEEYVNDVNCLRIHDDNREMVFFLAMLIWPFIDIYYVIALSLHSLLPHKILSQQEFVEICSRNAKIKYFEGDIDFFECVGIHSINNAINWFKSQGIIGAQSVVVSKSNFLTQSRGTTLAVVQLSESYRNKTALNELASIIDLYRKPTKSGQPRNNTNQRRHMTHINGIASEKRAMEKRAKL